MENRTSPRSPKFLFFDERVQYETDVEEKDDLFGDLFSKIQLKVVFFDKISKFEKISQLIITFLNKIHTILFNVHKTNKK